MSIIETFKQEKSASVPPKLPENNPTLREVISGKDGVLFGKMLEADGVDHELYERLTKGELKDDDLEELEKHRATFLERIKKSETVKETITQERLDMMVNSNPEFKKISNLVGADKVREIVLSKMNEIAVTDGARFDDIMKKVDTLKLTEGMAGQIDLKVEAIIAKHGLDKQKVAKVLLMNNSTERVREFTKMIKESSENIGWWRKGKNATMAAQDLDNQKSLITAVIGNMEHDVNELGTVLATDINSNPDLRSAIARSIIGEKEKKEENVSFKEMKSSMPSDEELVKEWEAEKASIVDWENLSDADKLTRKTEFLKKYEKGVKTKFASKKGFFAKVFAATFNLYSTKGKEGLLK